MFKVEEIARATGGTLIGDKSAMVTGVSTDSRLVKEGELFVAIKGDRFDGHDFVNASIARVSALSGSGRFSSGPSSGAKRLQDRRSGWKGLSWCRIRPVRAE